MVTFATVQPKHDSRQHLGIQPHSQKEAYKKYLVLIILQRV